MTDKDEIWKLWRVRKTLMQMCLDRGYMVTDGELEETLDGFKSKFVVDRLDRGQLTVLLEHQFDPTNRMHVFFPPEEVVDSKLVTFYCKKMHEENVPNGIIVIQSSLTPPAHKCILQLGPKFSLEPFYESELLVNITEHRLVSKHFVLTPEEKEAVLDKYSTKEHQLPRLLLTDPIARYYGMKRGQVVKIIRPSETAGRYVTYRVVA